MARAVTSRASWAPQLGGEGTGLGGGFPALRAQGRASPTCPGTGGVPRAERAIGNLPPSIPAVLSPAENVKTNCKSLFTSQ